MRAVIIFVSLCFVAVAIALLLNETRTMKITDLAKEDTITLTAPPKTGNIHGITLRIYGNIKGSATLSIGDLRTETISGTFDLRHEGDWYTPTCKLHYTPIGDGKVSGSMSIDYEFRD